MWASLQINRERKAKGWVNDRCNLIGMISFIPTVARLPNREMLCNDRQNAASDVALGFQASPKLENLQS
jgi:hypothetical protein